MPLSLYNTLTRKKEEFIPADKQAAKLYHCGPTVYHYAHLGNLRAFVFADILRRTIEANGYRVKQVMNITDVGHLTSDADTGEDKLEKGAKREGKSAKDISLFYTDAFFQDLKALNIKKADVYPRATENIPEQIDLIKKLEAKGYTYTTSDGVYFDTLKYEDYGTLAKLNLEGQVSTERVSENTEKRNTADFALWKFSPHDEKREQEWWAPWKNTTSKDNEKHISGTPRAVQPHRVQGSGEERSEAYDQTARVYGSWGFPGWHVECSAMAMKYLSETLDIHTGGIDHIPVHHTNERAQSVCATGKPFSRFWMHGGFVNVASGKMAKSEGNFLRLKSLDKYNIHPLAYRYWLLGAHYRTTIEFSWDALEGSAKALHRLYEYTRELPDKNGEIDRTYEQEFMDVLNDDLGTPEAIALVWKLVKDEEVAPKDKRATLLFFDKVLGLDLEHSDAYTVKNIGLSALPENIGKLVDLREKARKEKDWSEADRLRDEIQKEGYQVKDGENGPNIQQN